MDMGRVVADKAFANKVGRGLGVILVTDACSVDVNSRTVSLA